MLVTMHIDNTKSKQNAFSLKVIIYNIKHEMNKSKLNKSKTKPFNDIYIKV